MDRRQKALLKRILSVFVPLILLLVLSVVGTSVYFVDRMIHPDKRAVTLTPEGYQQILQKPNWEDRTWSGSGGTQISGWVFGRNQPAPVIILTHRYGANREELMSTAYRLWDKGYTVILYDLRAHGQSAVKTSSLGPAELDDLKATITFAKGLKSQAGVDLCDGRIGLFGADLGGFISLSAAANDPDIKALAVDSVYPSQDAYLQFQAKRLIGNTGAPGSSIVEGSIFQKLIKTSLGFMADSGTAPLTAAEAFQKIGQRPILIINGKNAPLRALSVQTAALAPNAQVLELDHSRSSATLYTDDARTYDDAIVSFFTQIPEFMPPTPEPKPGAKGDKK